MKTLLIKLGAAGIAMVGFWSAATAAEFQSADIHPDDYPTVRAVVYMGGLVQQRSGGRHTIKAVAKGALGQEKDVVEKLRTGELAMGRVNIAIMNNICPETIVPTLPFVFRSIPHMRKALDGPVGQDILRSCEPYGFVGLAYYDSGARSVYSKKPIRVLQDMRGLKIRVQQSDLWVSLTNAMGANPSPMPFGEVYNALKTGVVDAAENNWPSYESTKHYEVARYYSLTEHSMAPEMLLFSKKVWDTLSPQDQQIIRQAAKESVPYMRKLWDEREAMARKAIEASAARVVEVDKTSFSSAMRPVYAQFASEPKLRVLMRRVQSVL